MTELKALQEPYLIDLNQNQVPPVGDRQAAPKIICFYAEKGGVGKTTTCLALAHTFARDGYRVLIYDCDVQRSLTAWSFGINIEFNHGDQVNKCDNFIRSLPVPNNMKRSLYDQVEATTVDVQPAFATSINENLYIVAGDRRMPELDEKILRIEGICGELRGSMSNNRSARPYHAIMKTASWYKADLVFLDLNPYPSTLNRCLIMSSHFILIPICLDAFCLEMISMMESNLTSWKKKTDFVKRYTDLPGNLMTWPNHLPKFLGYIINIVMVYRNGVMRNNEQYWCEQINRQAANLTIKLGNNRHRTPLAITTEQYEATRTRQCLGKVTEYHGLGDISDLFRLPIPCLNETHFYKYKNEIDLFKRMSQDELEKKRKQLDRFIRTYKDIKENMIKLITYDQDHPNRLV